MFFLVIFNSSGLQANGQITQFGPLEIGPGAKRKHKPPTRPILNQRQYQRVNSARQYAERATLRHKQNFGLVSTYLNHIHKISLLKPCCRGHYMTIITDPQCGHFC